MFHFKHFSVSQANCAMKVNTDGVLLGALAEANSHQHILDIGTGTGVIALMLAQRFGEAIIDAVEIDERAVLTASSNFSKSIFSSRLNAFPNSFQDHFRDHPDSSYDLIVSNPPFFLNSLKSENEARKVARHTDEIFFNELVSFSSGHLNANGYLIVILPPETSLLIQKISSENGFYLQKKISVHSFEDSLAHREIIFLGFNTCDLIESKVVIYNSPKVYSQQYSTLFKDFLTIF
jgi:tRNA1Val (adenine37-N6)-methyltransferase